MIISANVSESARVMRRCMLCGKQMEKRQVRMFGAAEPCDKPYAVYVCEECYQGQKKLRR